MLHPKPVHFYHVWLGGDYSSIVDEHFSVLEESGFDGQIIQVSVQDGFEDITLNKLRSFCLQADPATPILYAHDKGSFRQLYLRDKATGEIYQPEIQGLWRQAMLDRLVRPWASRVEDLKCFDIVGPHWIDLPGKPPHFAGNFWWARAGYIAQLPMIRELDHTNRWEAETWISGANPRVKALSTGYESVPLPRTHGATAVEFWSPQGPLNIITHKESQDA